jgi:adenine C2-methylase RlmN of 23S rRNA A2503 and tRNA A37
MSETLENVEAITQALRIIDQGLGAMHTRELVSTSEVSDLLLDMRSILAAADLAGFDELEDVVSSSN